MQTVGLERRGQDVGNACCEVQAQAVVGALGGPDRVVLVARASNLFQSNSPFTGE